MLQFVREIPISLVIHGALSQRRGFLFRLQAGFSKPVDPLSGMSADLVLVNQWLAQIKADLQAQDFYSRSADNFNEALLEIHQATRVDLEELAASDGAKVESLSWVEERGFELSWQAKSDEVIFKTRHFVEDFSSGAFQLLQLKLHWSLPKEVSAVDLGHQGFLLLRKIQEPGPGLFWEKLCGQAGQDEFAQAHLTAADLKDMASERVLTLQKVDFQSVL